MDSVSVRCNSCGAPLEAGPEARFVTCKFCNTQLEIKRTDSSVYTQDISRIARNTAQMAEDLEAIRLQNEIEMLDREAATKSVSEFVQSSGGLQSRAGGVLGLAFAGFFALVCFGMAAMAGSHGAPVIFMFVPAGMGVFALAAAIMGALKSKDLAEKQDNTRSRRDELAARLQELKNPTRPTR